MTNSDFLSEVYGQFDAGEYGWVCSFRADPASDDPGKWAGRTYKGLPQQAALIDRAVDDNTYFCTSVLSATDDGEIVRRKDAFVRLAVLVLDDVQLSDVQGFSYAIQTSPGKHQIGIFLDGDDADARNRLLVDRVMSALAARGRSNDASGNACVRYVRLPGGTNTKPRAAGDWKVRLEVWSPNVRWSLDDACAAVGIDLDALRAVEVKAQSTTTHGPSPAGELVAGIMDPRLDQRAYHDSIVRMAASLVAGGMFPGAAVEHLYSLMDAARPDMRNAEEYRRWEARRAEIPRAVKSAEKFAPEERQSHVTVNLRLPGGSQDEPEHDQPRDLAPMDWGALSGVEPEPAQWSLDGWLPDGTVTLLSAHGGVGKSNLSLQLSVALGLGIEFLGLEVERKRVMVLSGEDEARTVHFRVANICRDAGIDMRELAGAVDVYDMTKSDCVLWRDGRPTERMQWLADTADACGAGVIVIDNASDVFADNENDRTAVRGFMRCLNMIAGATGAAVLLLAHVDKASVRAGAGLDSNTTFSGSTAWNNSARSRWAMVRDSDRQVMLRHEKCNLGPLQEEIGLEFDAGAKVFKRFGTIPSQRAADAVVKNTQRAVILKLIGRAASAGANMSMKPTAPSNVYAALRSDPEFPSRMDRRAFFALMRDLEAEGLVLQQNYMRSNRTQGQRVILTPAGEARVAIGSGAAPMWKQREEDHGDE